ncbi:MAG: tRNA epoxyqueuosine(34) reductase QueG, partial [Bacteroidales bacterium]
MMNLSEKEKKQITAEIKNFAKELGFDSCGIAPANELTIEKEHLNEWLKNKYNANMHYMERNTAKRCNPRELMESSAS